MTFDKEQLQWLLMTVSNAPIRTIEDGDTKADCMKEIISELKAESERNGD